MNKFEKVSLNEFKKAFMDILYSKSININFNIDKFENIVLPDCWQNLKVPQRSTKGSAGYDFVAPFDIVLKPDEGILIPTGIKCCLDADKVLQIYPRSSLGFKYGLVMANTVCIIDSDYYNNVNNEGHIMLKLINTGDLLIKINSGEKICQGLIMQYFLSDDDNVSAIRVGGLGSTGK